MRRGPLLFVCVAVWAVLSASSTVAADENYISPELVKVSTPLYQPAVADFHPQLGTYHYTVSWQGIPAADVSVDVAQEGLYYKLAISARTYSGIDIFYKLRYSAEGRISSVDYSPIRAAFKQRENSRQRFTEISYLEDGWVHAYRKSNGEEPKVLHFDPENFMLEPFSAAFLALSLDWEKGKERQFDVFNGKSRYLVTFTAQDKVRMRVNDQLRDVWVVSPKVINLTDSQANKKLREARIYVTADDRREVLQVVSSVFIGNVTTRLESFTPSGSTVGIRIAQRQVATFLK